MKKEETAEKKNTSGNPFPLDVLPKKMRDIVTEANAVLGFPKDYLAMSMLTAISAATGNTHMVEHMTCWQEYCILFVALVGRPGANKSHPLSFAMQPLIDFDAEQSAIFSEAMKRYLAAMELTPKERAANGYETNPTEPRRVRFTMQDVTPEAVHRILSENPRGLCLYADELAGWFKNFNRYNNGSESEFWMSVFNHKVAMSDRKSSQSGVFIRNPFLCVIGTIQPKVLGELAGWVKNFNRYNNGSESEFWMSVFNHKVAMSDRKGSQSGVFIRNPFLCVIGTIQPKVLTDLAAGNRNANGFMERILYVFPSDQTKPKWNRSRRMPSFDIAAEWRGILSQLIDIIPKVDADGEIIS